MSRKSRRPLPEVRPLEDRSVPATLSGAVFADLNGNGVRDATEPGLVGVTVQLDRAADGSAAASTLTDNLGNYSFAGVADGNRSVTVSPAAGTVPTGNGVVRTATVAGADVTVAGVGLQPSGKASGTIYADLNADGKRDANEPGVPGAVVALDLYGNGGVDLSAVTGSDGSYTFANIPDGSHKLTVSATANYQAVSPNPVIATVSNGGTVSGLDFGFKPLNAVQGKVTLGPNGAGVSGVTVQLDVNSDSKIDFATTTDTKGNYLFANVVPGKHLVAIVVPSNATVDTPDGSPRRQVTVANDLNTGVNFGVTYPGSVTSGVFLDANGNGKRDASEIGLPAQNVQLDLYNGGTLIPVTAKAGTDGVFTVTGIPDGTHTLVMTPAGGYAGTSPTRTTFTITNGGGVTLDPFGQKQSVGGTVAVGNGSGPGAVVYSFTVDSKGTLVATPGLQLTPPTKGGSRVIQADVNADGTDDVITAAGPGDAPVVRIYDGRTGAEIIPGGLQVFEATFAGGVNLAVGDFTADGKPDLVAAADTGGGPRVRVFDLAQFQVGADPAKAKVIGDFFGIDDPDFRGGARVAAGDLNGDGVADLVVAAGTGGGPRVAVFDGTSVGAGKFPQRLIGDFFAYESSLRNGAVVSVGDFNGDGKMDLVTGAGPGGSPRVTVFSGPDVMGNKGAESVRIADFFVNSNTGGRTGTRLTVKDLDGDGKADLVAADGSRAFVYTGQSLLAYYLNPVGLAPIAALELAPFTGSRSVNVG
jgi:uncharacterized protein (DUF2141 family)